MNNIFGYILLILYLIAFIIGFSTILYSIIYYTIERITWLKYYIVFLFTFGLLLLIRAIKLLSFLTIPSFLSNNIFNILYFFTLSVSMALMLFFITAFLNLKWAVRENIQYLILSVIFFIMNILGILLNFNFYIFGNIIFYISTLFLFILGFLNYKNIEDKTIKFIVKILGLITIFIYPIMVYQLIIINKNSLDIGSIDLTLVLFYIWWNLVMLGYLLWYFISIIKNKNVFINENLINNSNNLKNVDKKDNTIKQESNKKDIINLTKREKQILSYLLSGKTNKEVALILDISLNTVNNHVANIYDKSGVKNRVELVNKFSK